MVTEIRACEIKTRGNEQQNQISKAHGASQSTRNISLDFSSFDRISRILAISTMYECT